MSTADDKALDALLCVDPLAEAEMYTGKDYSTDAQTSTLGFALLQQSSKAKKEVLAAAGDTYRSMAYSQLGVVLHEAGFVHGVNYPNPHPSDPDGQLDLWVHPEHALLLVSTSFQGAVNTAEMFFNWYPAGEHPDAAVRRSLGSHSGCGDDDDRTVFLCGLDVLEGLKFHLRRLAQYGQFASPWYTPPFVWIRTYADADDPRELASTDPYGLSKMYLAGLPDELGALFAPRGLHHRFDCTCALGTPDVHCGKPHL